MTKTKMYWQFFDFIEINFNCEIYYIFRRVHALNKRGIIMEEFKAFTYLMVL